MENTKDQIQFNFSYYALKLLGKNLYNNPWSAISELVANGLDAQANNVKLYINMINKEHSTIEILDNGIGMSYDDLANKYVFMGKNKRNDTQIPDDIKRTLMGRKGIGKLAALYLSKKYYIITKRFQENDTCWFLDSENVDESDIPTLNKCNISEVNTEIINEWKNVKSGTLIKLTDVDLTGLGYQKIEGLKCRLSNFFLTDTLKSNIEICVLFNSKDPIIFHKVEKNIAFKNMYAFFSNDHENMLNNIAKTVVVGKTKYPQVSRKKRNVQIFQKEEFPNIIGEKILTSKSGPITVKYELTGWIGLHTSIENQYAQMNDKRYIKNEAFNPNQLRLYVRKKLAVENFLDILKNTQAFSNYIEGEISFDILDDDRFEDIATTNRQSLVTDDERVKLLIEILNPIIGKMIRERIKLGSEISNEEKAIEDEEKRKKEQEKEELKQKFQEEKEKKEQAEAETQQEKQKREKAEESAKQANEEKEKAETEAKSEKKRAKFIEGSLTEDQKRFMGRLHIIKINIQAMEAIIGNVVKLVQRNMFNKDEAWKKLKKLSYAVARIDAALNITPYAKFNTKNEIIEADLFAFIKEYLENTLINCGSLKIYAVNEENAIHNIKFSPQDIIVILDNIISNSAKAEHHASKLEVKMSKQDNKALITFEDNGVGLNKAVQDINDIFEFGKSYTSSGSGVGLYHIKQIVEDNLHGEVSVTKKEKGFTLQIRI